MKHSVDGPIAQNMRDMIAICKIALDERSAYNRICKASREIIENDDAMPSLRKVLHHVRANIACAADHKAIHDA
jgi:hypothetical protein